MRACALETGYSFVIREIGEAAHPATPSRLRAAERLLQQLDEGAARELTLVWAPAGFGKTCLLADLAGWSQQAVWWLSFDQATMTPPCSTALRSGSSSYFISSPAS
jgi:hypothetical protein